MHRAAGRIDGSNDCGIDPLYRDRRWIRWRRSQPQIEREGAEEHREENDRGKDGAPVSARRGSSVFRSIGNVICPTFHADQNAAARQWRSLPTALMLFVGYRVPGPLSNDDDSIRRAAREVLCFSFRPYDLDRIKMVGDS